jgi:uncharacterized protein YqeY
METNSLQQTIKAGIKEALFAKDEVRLSVLRGLSTAFTNELVASGKTPQDALPDDKALAVIRRTLNQRKDAIDQFTKGGRPELAEAEAREVPILQKFLPAMMSKDEIKKIVAAKASELGIGPGDKAKAGQLMSAAMKELKGKADGADVKEVADALFS